jgi:putative acyl-CoA dehydrogenase
MINEAAECMGGAGYVEDSILPRLYREAPVNSTWEGSGNVQCLDVLRALSKEPGVLDALFGTGGWTWRPATFGAAHRAIQNRL